MNPTDPNFVASTTSVLTYLGVGAHAAGIASLLSTVGLLLAQAMPFLPVASTTSPAWYRGAYGFLARTVGAWRNNAPMPPAGAQPAGGIVPTPPALKVMP